MPDEQTQFENWLRSMYEAYQAVLKDTEATIDARLRSGADVNRLLDVRQYLRVKLEHFSRAPNE